MYGECPSVWVVAKQVSGVSHAVVPIKLIASFNKVKALTPDVSVLTSALRTSDMLEVSTVALVTYMSTVRDWES